MNKKRMRKRVKKRLTKEEEKAEDSKGEKRSKKRGRGNINGEKVKEKRKELKKTEPRTPTIDRPVRERKSVERLVASIEKDATKEFHIEKVCFVFSFTFEIFTLSYAFILT